MADGRYLLRQPAGAGGEEPDGGGEGEQGERVLVVQTLGAPPPPLRRRRRPRRAEPGAEAAPLPLTRVTAVRASTPLDDVAAAEAWLEEALGSEESIDALLDEAVAELNRGLHAQATASADPYGSELRREAAAAARIGYGAGEELAAGRFAAAREVDPRSGVSARRRRDEELRPQQRVAAALGGRESFAACEPLLLRARADLAAGRGREAALQLRVGLEALLAELADALSHEDHRRDVGTLRERRREVGAAADEALRGELGAGSLAAVEELLGICERVLRRRRVLGE